MKRCRVAVLLLVLSAVGIGALVSTHPVAAGVLDYTPLEAVPGSAATGKFPEYVKALYKFALWAVGIAALFMLSIGGMMYLTSAGNTSQISTAKKVIFDAIIGLVLAIVSWLILYVINPQLIEVNLEAFKLAGGAAAPSINGTDPGATIGCGKIIEAAHSMVGGSCTYNQPHRNGCNGNPAFSDCSNFTTTAYKKAGCKSPPDTTAGMMPVAGRYDGNQSGLKAGDALVYRYDNNTKGHVVLCENDGCTTITAASGTKTGLVKGQSSAPYLTRPGLSVLRAASYCAEAINASNC